MDEDTTNIADLRDKILKGLYLAFEKLVREKQKEDGEFVFLKNGEIVRIKARSLATE